MASPFSDHAVLQRGQEVPIWGTANPAVQVTVSFAKQSKTVVADEAGRWSVSLDAMPGAFEGRSLTVKCSSGDSIEFEDVVVGEVWICAGQSNMVSSVQQIPDVKAILPKVREVRSFEVGRTVAMSEREELAGEWKVAHSSSAVATAFAYFLQEEAEVPVGILLTAWGSSSLEAWMPSELREESPHFKILMDEFDADSETRERIKSILDGKKPWSRKDDIFLRRQSNILYNAMLHPLIPYSCRGMVWYQGERNTQSLHGMVKKTWFFRSSGMMKYGGTLKLWMQCLRSRWENEEFQFLVVMLPGYHKSDATSAEDPDVHSWAWMRESQLQALELSHVAVANTIDLGNRKNIHPLDKLPIGERLALLAAHDVLGKELVARGPVVQSVKIEGSELTVSWQHAEGLKTLDEKAPTGFWVSGSGGKWMPAKARIDEASVVLSAEGVSQPLFIRYAFAGKPQVNLVNGANLPAYPFRTDQFEP